jgi:hypothetical protein
MSYTVQQHHVLQYSQNVEMLLQQSGYRLPAFVSRGTYTGKAGSPVDQIGAIGVIRNRSRHSDTPHISVPGDRRWVYPNTLTASTLVDNLDVTRVLIDLKSSYVKAIANAMGRAYDDEIGVAFFGSAMTGEQGTTPIAFPAAQQVGVNVGGANSGLNVPKLRAAKRYLMAAGVDISTTPIHMTITSVEHDNLLGELQVTNMDYTEKPVLNEGRVTSFLGIQFHHVEWQSLLTDGVTPSYPLSLSTIVPGGTGGTTRALPVWVEEGMHFGTWDALQNRVDPRPDKNYNWQLWSEGQAGGARLQEKKVVMINTNG